MRDVETVCEEDFYKSLGVETMSRLGSLEFTVPGFRVGGFKASS